MKILPNITTVQDGESKVPENDKGESEEMAESSTKLSEEGGERVQKLLGIGLVMWPHLLHKCTLKRAVWGTRCASRITPGCILNHLSTIPACRSSFVGLYGLRLLVGGQRVDWMAGSLDPQHYLLPYLFPFIRFYTPYPSLLAWFCGTKI